MAHHDRRFLPLSTASDLAAAQYREGIDLMLAAWPGAAEALDAAIAADPGFALAHAARARLHAMRAEPAAARARIAVAAERVAQAGTERERSHVAVLSLAIDGRSGEALEHALAHAEAWPRDALILSMPLGAFGLLAFSGRADHDQARVDLCERHAGAYAPDDWWFAISRGWALTENGAVARGRALTERGFGLRRENANGAHALSHALFEDGAGEEAEALIAGWLPGYDRAGVLHGHIAWHAALAALERGDAQAALALYGAHVRPGVTAGLALNVVTDAVSLLWRLSAYGHAVPAGLWDEVRAYAAPRFGRPASALPTCIWACSPPRPATGRARRRASPTSPPSSRPAPWRRGRWCRRSAAPPSPSRTRSGSRACGSSTPSPPRWCASAAAAPSAR